MTISVAIADNHVLSRLHLQSMLSGFDDVDVLCASPSSLMLANELGNRAVDALYLDMDQQEDDHAELLAEFPGSTPAIVYVSAHAQYTTRAAKVPAVDYLLKPYAPERVSESLRRVRARTVLPRRYPDRLALPIGRRTELVAVTDIDYLSAHANYVCVHVGKREFVLRESMAAMQAKLDPYAFLRVHRSCLVRVDSISELESIASGRHLLRLRSGASVEAGRGARDALRCRLGITH
jgi:two-component system, LytTR family, response regulator